jgi:hypothetical protein
MNGFPVRGQTPAMAQALPNKRTTLSAVDWEQAALKMIAELGLSSVAVEPLAKRMGIT